MPGTLLDPSHILILKTILRGWFYFKNNNNSSSNNDIFQLRELRQIKHLARAAQLVSGRTGMYPGR